MNSRYYNPETGRFTSQDTYSGNPYDPWTQHLYSYCGNNPVNMVDSTGHRSRYSKYIEAGRDISYQRWDKYAKEVNELTEQIGILENSGDNVNKYLLERKKSELKFCIENRDYHWTQYLTFQKWLEQNDLVARAEDVERAKNQKNGFVGQVSQNVTISVLFYTNETRWSISVDSYGNASLQKTTGHYFSFIPALGVSSNTIASFWNARTPSDIEGEGGGIGAGVNVPTPWGFSGTAGGSYITADNSYGDDYAGGEFILGGIGLPNGKGLSISAGRTMTETTYEYKLWG